MSTNNPVLDPVNAEIQEAYHQATAPAAEAAAMTQPETATPQEASDGKVDTSDLQKAAGDLLSRISSLPESAKTALQGVDISSLSSGSITARDYEALRSQLQSVISASETAVGNAESIAREEEGKKIQQAMGEMIGGIAATTAAFDSIGAIAGAIGGGAALTGAMMGLTEPHAEQPSVNAPHTDPAPQLLNPAARAMGINTDTHGAVLDTLTTQNINTDPMQVQQDKLANFGKELAKVVGGLAARAGTLGTDGMDFTALNADGSVDASKYTANQADYFTNIRPNFGGYESQVLAYAPTPATGIGIG